MTLSFQEYRRFIESDRILSPHADCVASAIVVAYLGEAVLLSCLDSLFAQSAQPLQVTVVDNGIASSLVDSILRTRADYVRLRRNYGPSLARNVGALYAKSGVLCFVDDDGVADSRMIEMHLAAYAKTGAVAIRGRYSPRTRSAYLSLCDGYDYGDEIVPAPLNIEGNMSVRKPAFMRVRGFDPRLFGFEGRELTTRLLAAGFRREQILYVPRAILYHDVRPSLRIQLSKEIRHARARVFADAMHGKLVGMSRYSLRPQDLLVGCDFPTRLAGSFLRWLVGTAAALATCYFRRKVSAGRVVPSSKRELSFSSLPSTRAIVS